MGRSGVRHEEHQIDERIDSYIFLLAAEHEGDVIGVVIAFPREWDRNPPPGAPPGFMEFQHSVILARRKHAFLAALSRLYELPPPPREMADWTTVAAVTLQGDPQHVLEAPVHLKLFFGPDEGDRIPYAEAYLRIDVPRGVVQLNEKDPEYRTAIIEGLLRGTVEGL